MNVRDSRYPCGRSTAATFLLALLLSSPFAAAQPGPSADADEAIAALRSHLATLPPNLLRPTFRFEIEQRLQRAIAELSASDACDASDEILELIARLDDFRRQVGRSLNAPSSRPGTIDPQAERLAVLDDLEERLLRVRLAVLAERSPGIGCGGGASVAVDPTLTPQIGSLPAFEEGGPERPLATMRSSRGAQVDFVANEVWLVADADTASELAARLGAAVVATQVGDDGSLHWLLRVEVADADPAALPGLLEELRPGVTEAVAVSSEEARRLLALIAREAADGLEAAVNWVGRPDSIRTGATVDAVDGPNLFAFTPTGWSSNAFDWIHFGAGFAQGIGVPEAWQLLELAGRLVPESVGIGIVDQGFVANDLTPAAVFRSTIAGFDGLGSESPIAGWHGAKSSQTAAGLVDNGIGAAGTAGPVALPINVYSSYDYFLAMAGIRTAIDNGARVVSMSFSADIPSIFDWTILPFRAFTGELRNVILVASAGNNGPNSDPDADPDTGNVDATECFGVCWEVTFVTPCENENVVCVGGLGRNSLFRSPGTSYGVTHDLDILGNSSVDVYAPFTGVVDGIGFPTVAESYSGTSHSAPYVAGIYGLMLAANPVADEEDVAVRLLTRSDSSDPVVHAIVDALASVRFALPSLINIVEPADGHGVPVGVEVAFESFQHPTPHGEVVWTSDLDGEIGRGDSIATSSLSLGSHRITATAGAFSDAIVVNVGSIGIVSPIDGQTFVTGAVDASGEFVAEVTLRGVAVDAEDGALTGASLVWTDRVNGGAPVEIATGETADVLLATVGGSLTTHEITLTATDSEGNQQSSTVTVQVSTLF